MENWRVKSILGGQTLAEVKIQRGIFQRDSFSPLLFVIARMPLNHRRGGWKFSKSQENINHLMYIDVKMYLQKMKKNWRTWYKRLNIYILDLGRKFGIEKCDILIMRNELRKSTEGIELPNQERIRTLGEKENYKYLAILETDTIKQVDMKEKILKRVSQKNEKASRNQALQQKSNQRNKHLGCLPCKILGTILKNKQGRNSNYGTKGQGNWWRCTSDR